MIPKIIHYCWFGGKPIPDDVKAYMDTWRRHFPDFEIKRWDESNFDVNSYTYTQQAYYAKNYAFVSDVARLKALYEEGGLYMDTDILVKKPFPPEWFDLDGFGSFEHDRYVQTGVIGASQGNEIIHRFLRSYDDRTFFRGLSYDITTNVSVFTKLMTDIGFRMDNNQQAIDGFLLLPQILLCGNDWIEGRYDDDTTYAVHDFKGGWGREDKSILKYKTVCISTIIRWLLANLLNNHV